MHFASADPDGELPPGFRKLDPRRELFGLGACALLLDENYEEFQAMQKASRLHAMARRPRQFLSLRAPEGCGLRTMVVNWCRERRVNLLYFGQPAYPSRYDYGTYAKLVQRARAMEPCVVLIDRLDQHWSPAEYASRGAELDAYWRHCGYDRRSPYEPLWFVVSHSGPIAEAFAATLDGCWAAAAALEAGECALILRRAYADCLLVVGIADDRPALPDGEYATEADYVRVEQKIAESAFHRALAAKEDLFRQLGELVYQSTFNKAGFVHPQKLYSYMQDALATAWRRHSRSGAATTAEALLPTDEEIREAASRTFG